MLASKGSVSKLVTAGLTLSLGVLGSSAQAGGFQTIVTVGFSANCDFGDLQDAIDAASTNSDDNTIVRLTRGFSAQALRITDRNIEIDGRWSSCTANLPQAGLRQTLSGNGGDSVLNVSTALLPIRNVVLRGLILRGGGVSDVLTERGGGLAVNGRVNAEVLESRIGDNESVNGGGVAVTGQFATLRLDEGTIVGADETISLVGNRAINLGPADAQGGGIYCAGNATLTLNDARIRANTSVGNGGGVYLNDCEMRIEPRPEFVGDGDGFVTLFQNSSNGNGGGLYATNGSTVFWRSLPTGSFAGRAAQNRANGRGGAVYLTASSFVGDWIRIEESRADGRGGGFAVEDASSLILRGPPGFACSGVNCPGIFGTRGITEGESATLIGGAIYAESGGTVDLRQAHIYDNFANNGSAMHISGATSLASLHSVLIARNVLYGVGNALSTIELTSSADATLRYVTMAGNFRVSDQFPGLAFALSSIRANGASSVVELRNSILWNDADQLLRFLVGASATGSCVFGHENASFALTNINDPLFVDTTGTNPNFALQPGSPAIDRCAASGGNEVDLFGRTRPQDLPEVTNGFGTFDAGAIEALPDGMFADGFEG